MGEENRIHRRVNIRAEVWRGEDGLFARSNQRLDDLSVGGAFIAGAGSSIGRILNLRFKLPDGTDFITVTAIARNSRGDGVGVEFLDLSPENRDRLQSYVDSNS